MPGAPPFRDAKRSAEARLSGALDGACSVEVSHALSDAQRGTILAIDDVMFREELRYTRAELEERSHRPGFTCFLLSLEGKPIAYDYGYDDDEPGAFYSDSAATLIERRGVGSTLSALEAVYCYGRGYRRVKLSTEERDEVGRALRRYWERFGFTVISTDEDDNIVMVMELTTEAVVGLHGKYIA
ncbi:hypothetical protein A3K81_05680 [Candidatus Bathyarchaeota archaeon RBG_13_60_20]|nr:MAG: hypothetical protein A3K81_05680 [Candidatus Bathyarchaeota archaeon RBG_13_60_20]